MDKHMFDSLTREQLDILCTALGSKCHEWRNNHMVDWYNTINPIHQIAVHAWCVKKCEQESLPGNS